jgi:hypothetical protein
MLYFSEQLCCLAMHNFLIKRIVFGLGVARYDRASRTRRGATGTAEPPAQRASATVKTSALLLLRC